MDIIKRFREKFGEESGIYYGKDFDGNRNFIPNGALEDIENFLQSELKKENQAIIEKAGEMFKKYKNPYPEKHLVENRYFCSACGKEVWKFEFEEHLENCQIDINQLEDDFLSLLKE